MRVFFLISNRLSSPKSSAVRFATQRKIAAGSSCSSQPASLAVYRQAVNAPFESASTITADGTEQCTTFSTTTLVPSATATEAITDTSAVQRAQLLL